MASKKRIWPEWYRLIQGRDILYPENEFKFTVIPEGLWKNIQRRAAELLKEKLTASEKERQHWEGIVAGKIPYGLKIETIAQKRGK